MQDLYVKNNNYFKLQDKMLEYFKKLILRKVFILINRFIKLTNQTNH